MKDPARVWCQVSLSLSDLPARLSTYEQVVECLYGRINYERIAGSAFAVTDFKLDRMRDILARIGNPQRAIPVVHIAGTKGKGSTAAFVASVLRAAGHGTGLFTSPHLHAFEERMTVDGVCPTRDELVDLFNRLLPHIEAMDVQGGSASPTYFEIATALGWMYFTDKGASIAVLEVGLGGRLDATNVCDPLVTVVTTISRDHTQQLGATLPLIAAEKAGILKAGIPCVTGDSKPEVLDVLRRVAADLNPQQAGADLLRCVGTEFSYTWTKGDPQSALLGTYCQDSVSIRVPARAQDSDRPTADAIEIHDLKLPLLGNHQALNAAVAVAAIAELRRTGWQIPDEAVRDGLLHTRWPARIEVLGVRPCVVVDAGHNWAAISALLTTIDQQFPARRRILVFAATRDKDVSGLLRQLLPSFDTVIATAYRSNPRALPVADLAELIGAFGADCHQAAEPAAAWRLARSLAGGDDLIVVTGSIFIAAEIRLLVAPT